MSKYESDEALNDAQKLIHEVRKICLEWYRFGCEDGYYNEEGVNAMDAFWEILNLLGVTQEEMDDFDLEAM